MLKRATQPALVWLGFRASDQKGPATVYHGVTIPMYRLFALAVVTIAVVVACDTVPLTSPTGSTISLSIDKSVLPINGQATVRAVVTESSGTAVHNGTMVTFQPSIGTVNPPEAPTINGIATATFLAGTASGTGFIHAFSGPARTGSGNASSGGVEVKIGAAAAGALSVSSTPPSISQSGGTVTISALVLDSANNPLPGVNVLFTASNGALSATQALSDANGIARVTLTTSQTSTVTAIAGSAKGDTQVVVSTAPNMTVTAADGTAGLPISITVGFTGGSGNSSPRQIATLTVDFGDGTSDTRTNVTGAVALTHTYQQAGGYVVTARAVDVDGNTGIASDATTITHAPQPTVTLTASDNNPTVNEVFTMTVTATAANANTPIRSVVVRTNDGTVLYSGSGSGTFAVQFTSPGTRTITATATDANNQSGTTSTVVIVQ
jgi:hypothetical protein